MFECKVYKVLYRLWETYRQRYIWNTPIEEASKNCEKKHRKDRRRPLGYRLYICFDLNDKIIYKIYSMEYCNAGEYKFSPDVWLSWPTELYHLFQYVYSEWCSTCDKYWSEIERPTAYQRPVTHVSLLTFFKVQTYSFVSHKRILIINFTYISMHKQV